MGALFKISLFTGFTSVAMFGCESEQFQDLRQTPLSPKSNQELSLVSNDLNFRQSPTKASVNSGGEGLPAFAADPMVHIDSEGYHLFFTNVFCRDGNNNLTLSITSHNAAECSGVMATIAYAFSSDKGINWSYRNTPIITTGPNSFDNKKIETAFVVPRDGKLILFYSAHSDQSKYQIGAATLDLQGDSIKTALISQSRAFVKRSAPVLPGMDNNRFDKEVMEPSVVWNSQAGNYQLFFIGFNLGTGYGGLGMGLAILTPDFGVVVRSDEPLLGGQFDPTTSIDTIPNFSEVRYFDNRYHLFSTALHEGQFHEQEEINHFTSTDLHSWAPSGVILPRSQRAYENWGIMGPTVAVDDDQLIMFYSAFEAVDGPCSSGDRFGLANAVANKCIFGTVGRAAQCPCFSLGDLTCDMVIDGQDWLGWNDKKFQQIEPENGPDFNGDGIIDGRDFLIWSNNKFKNCVDLLP